MKHLRNRLKKLEAAANSDPSWGDQLASVLACATASLSPADRALRQEAEDLITGGQEKNWSEAHRAVWQRWKDALGRACDRSPLGFRIDADDLLL